MGGKPYVLGIGGRRCSSTSAYNYIRTSLESAYWPQEYRLGRIGRRPKELHFWDRNYSKGYEWYENHFVPNVPDIDVTPAYSLLTFAKVREIANYLPDVRVFFIARNPIDVYWSNIKIRCNNLGIKPAVSLNTSGRLLIKPRQFDYSRIVRQWNSNFGERFKVFYFDQMLEDPERFGSSLLEHLHVPNAGLTYPHKNSTLDQPIPTELCNQLVDHFKPIVETWRKDLDDHYIGKWLHEMTRL